MSVDGFRLGMPVGYWGLLDGSYEDALRVHYGCVGRFEFLCGRCWKVLGGRGFHFGHGRVYGEDCWELMVSRQYGLRYEWGDGGVRGRLCGVEELKEFRCEVSGVSFLGLEGNVRRCGVGVRSCVECGWNGLWNRGGKCGFERSFE